MSASMVVARDGAVSVDGTRRGWVDHYNPSSPFKKSHLWRGIREGGQFRFGFKTRSEAAAWVVAA